MIHGNVKGFKKLVDLKGSPHNNEVLINITSTMMGGEEPNEKIPAGWTYFGQFVDHDLTFDKGSGINARTPIFDLDSLYGEGPSEGAHTEIYEGEKGKETFKIGNGGNADADLLRDDKFVAQIPDPRNDENILIASLQILFQKLHNLLIQSAGLNFSQAKQAVQWHYQSVVKYDFLPRIVGNPKIKEIEDNGRRIFTPKDVNEIFMPIEYSGACYRFGHSMVRERYSFNDVFNDTRSNANLFFKFPGGRPIEGGHQITDIWSIQGNGNSLLRFFDPTVLDPQFDADNFSGKIDTKLPPVLSHLEVPAGHNNILALRNLQTGQRLELPNGQQMATELLNRGINVQRLSEGEILSGGEPIEIANNTPLWFYILKEASLQKDGKMLGDVGGTVVAETIIGLLDVDLNSISNNELEDWPFKVGSKESEQVTMIELINFVDENNR